MFATMEREMQGVFPFFKVHRCFWMSTRSSSEPSLYIVYIISNVVSDLGTLPMFFSCGLFFCRTSLMKVRRTLEKLLRWRAKWINMGQRVNENWDSRQPDRSYEAMDSALCDGWKESTSRKSNQGVWHSKNWVLYTARIHGNCGNMATHWTGVDSAHRGPCNSNGFLTIGKPTALMPGTQKFQLARINVEVLTPWHVDTCCTQLLAILRGSRFLKQRNWIGDTVPIFLASSLRFRWITISTRFSDTCARSKTSSRVRTIQTIPFFEILQCYPFSKAHAHVRQTRWAPA